MSDNSSKFVGSIPENYDAGLGPNIFEEYATRMAERAGQVRATDVLELAAGTGIVSRRLRDRLDPGARLVVTDLNAPMLDVAAAKFARGEAVEFQPADAMALPFENAAFDLVVCQFGVMFFPNKVASMREAARVVRPGGHYLFSTWGRMADNPFSQVAYEVGAAFFPDDPPGFYQVPFSYHDADAVKRDFASAGWRDVQHQELVIAHTITDVAGFARGLVYGNPLIDDIRGRGGVDPDDMMRRVQDRLIARFGQQPATMPLKAFIFSGVKV